jgi:hypothetical protein
MKLVPITTKLGIRFSIFPLDGVIPFHDGRDMVVRVATHHE